MDKPTVDYTSNEFDDVMNNDFSVAVNDPTADSDDDDVDIYQDEEVLDMPMMISSDEPSDDAAAALSDATTNVPEKLTTIPAQERALKRMGNISRYGMNMECTRDYFEVGRTELENVVQEREKELADEEKRLSIIYDAVSFYKKKMAAVIVELEEIMSSRRVIVECEPWEIELNNAISIFDKDKYMSGEYNV